MAVTKEGALKIAAKRIGISIEQYQANIANGLKWCTGCKSWQSRSIFNVDLSRGDGLSSRCHQCSRVKIRKSHKGRVSTFKGRTHTEEAKRKISIARKGWISPFRGIPRSAEVRQKISQILRVNGARGARNGNWKGGISLGDARLSTAYQDWRYAVYERDEYTCQSCGDRRGGNLQAHHIQSFADHPDLRLVVSNGITLCRDCHERIHLKPIPTPRDLARRRKHR